MKENLTELVFVLDKSGSMAGLENDTVGGFNTLLQKQKVLDGEANVTTVLFNTTDTMLYFRKNIQFVTEMTTEDFVVGGGTALLDSFGNMIDLIGKALSDTKEEDRPSKVIFVIMTDGEENSSQKYSVSQIKQMVERQRQQYSWEFVFLGANIDAISTAESYGMNAQHACPIFVGSYIESFGSIDNAVSSYRINKKIDDKWANNMKEKKEMNV